MLFRIVATLLIFIPFSTGFSAALVRNQRHRFELSMANSPLETLSSGLANLADRSREIRDVIPSKISMKHPHPLPITKRAESSAELSFEPVRVFGKGHPGTGGKGTLACFPPRLHFHSHLPFLFFHFRWYPNHHSCCMKDLKFLLGGKGANLAEMSAIGLSVPPGQSFSSAL